MGVSVNNQDNKQDNHIDFMNLNEMMNLRTITIGNVGGNYGGGITSDTDGSVSVPIPVLMLQNLDDDDVITVGNVGGNYGGGITSTTSGSLGFSMGGKKKLLMLI